MANVDYHIYLHNSGGGTPTKPTQPSPANQRKKQTAPQQKNFFESAKDYVKQVKTHVTDELKDIEVAADAVFVAAIIKSAFEAVDFVYENTISFHTTGTGDYYFYDQINKWKQRTQMFFNPIDSILTLANANQQRRVSNRNAEAQRLLTGDTFLNYNYGERGRKI